jgi:hypothetical protein
MRIKKIISGGQSGVDIGVLDFSIENKISCDGWCPKGRCNEDGFIPYHYPLKEAPLEDTACRTFLNILDSDGTLILSLKNYLQDGTDLTHNLCLLIKKPVLILDLNDSISTNILLAKEFIAQNEIEVINIAGNRESQSQGIYRKTIEFLQGLFDD